MLTRSRDLWSGNSVWSSYAHKDEADHAVTSDLETDFIVVGAGVTGATIAQALAEEGYEVIMIEKRHPAKGSTFASTALLQYDVDQPILQLSKKIGRDNACRAWLRSYKAFERLENKTKELGIDADIQKQASVYLSGNVLDEGKMRQEADIRNAIGLETEFLDKKQIFDQYGITRDAALRIDKSWSANPFKLATGYLHDALKNNARLFSPVEVHDIQEQVDGVIVHTDLDFEIKAKGIIFATGYELFKKISLKKKMIASSWAIATAPQPSLLWQGKDHIWEASDPYLYIRTTIDGRVICGGEDEEFGNEQKRDALIPEKTRTLEEKLSALIPYIDARAEYSWAGCFGETDTGLPMVGAVPGFKHTYAILGFGGNGITFSHLGADLLMNTLQGKDDPDADLFKIE